MANVTVYETWWAIFVLIYVFAEIFNLLEKINYI